MPAGESTPAFDRNVETDRLTVPAGLPAPGEPGSFSRDRQRSLVTTRPREGFMSRTRKATAFPSTSQTTVAFPAGLLDLWIHSSDAYLTGLSAWIAETARFSSHRLQENRVALNCLRECSTWPELATLQAQWTATTLQDYLAETGRAGQLLQRCTAGSAQVADGARAEAREAA